MAGIGRVIGDAFQAVLKGARRADEGLEGMPRNLGNHTRTIGRGVDDVDKFDNTVTTRGRNEKTTYFDPDTGRPSREQGTILEDFGGSRRGDNATAVGNLGRSTDDGGHLGAHRFFGDTPDAGIAPQASNLNRGPWRSMENEWANWVNKGYRVDYDIDVYPPGAVRPDSFEVSYTVSNPETGQVAYRNWPSFWNEAGESFDSVRPGDMPDLNR